MFDQQSDPMFVPDCVNELRRGTLIALNLGTFIALNQRLVAVKGAIIWRNSIAASVRIWVLRLEFRAGGLTNQL